LPSPLCAAAKLLSSPRTMAVLSLPLILDPLMSLS